MYNVYRPYKCAVFCIRHERVKLITYAYMTSMPYMRLFALSSMKMKLIPAPYMILYALYGKKPYMVKSPKQMQRAF
jgi:hypothetical protein